MFWPMDRRAARLACLLVPARVQTRRTRHGQQLRLKFLGTEAEHLPAGPPQRLGSFRKMAPAKSARADAY